MKTCAGVGSIRGGGSGGVGGLCEAALMWKRLRGKRRREGIMEMLDFSTAEASRLKNMKGSTLLRFQGFLARIYNHI